jgi:prophage antirepressor-like protein
MSIEKDKLSVFEGRQIRKALHEGEWWFSIIDVVDVLVGGDRPRKYWNDLKNKLLQEGYDQLSEKIGQLKMQSSDGKFYATDCANTETLFRIIQSIPSPKVEPLKRWLARVGKERIDAKGNVQEAGLSKQNGREISTLSPRQNFLRVVCFVNKINSLNSVGAPTLSWVQPEGDHRANAWMEALKSCQ